jgi:hypothetical protein
MDRRTRAGGAVAARYLAIAEVEIGTNATAGDFDRALERCARYQQTLPPYDRASVETAAAWVHAARAVLRGEQGARELLGEAAALARSRHDFLPLRYANHLMARLCARCARMEHRARLHPRDRFAAELEAAGRRDAELGPGRCA